MACVLIVDDDEADRLLLEAMLRPDEHELLFAASGEEALKLYLRHAVDVVVTDIQMPHGDGIELISALRGLDPDSKIIAVSGRAMHTLEIAQLAGAVAILPKPVDRDRLSRAVHAAAGGGGATDAPPSF